MPSLAAVLMMRQAISPRLAIRILLNINNHHPDNVGSFAPLAPMIGAKAGRTIEDAEPQPAPPWAPQMGGGPILPEPRWPAGPCACCWPSGRDHRRPLHEGA